MVIKLDFDHKFHTSQITRNGSYVDGYARETGVIHVEGEFKSVRTNDNVLIPFNRVTAHADITVYAGLTVSPAEVIIPWDPVESFR